MRTVLVTAVLTLAIDQGAKDLLRRRLGARSYGSERGPRCGWSARACGSLAPIASRASAACGWCGHWQRVPSSRLPDGSRLSSLPVGLLLGGSLSHAWETTARGSVSDYICSKWWPAFNLADVAITAGTVGILLTGTLALRAALG